MKRKLSGAIVKRLSYDLQSGLESIHCAVIQIKIPFISDHFL